LQSRTGHHDLDVGIDVAQRLEQHQGAAEVDVEVGPRIFHAADRTRLPREVEDVLLAGDERGHEAPLAQVAFHDFHAVTFELGGLPGVALARRREHRQACALRDQP
jgi:hypothetical protein